MSNTKDSLDHDGKIRGDSEEPNGGQGYMASSIRKLFSTNEIASVSSA